MRMAAKWCALKPAALLYDVLLVPAKLLILRSTSLRRQTLYPSELRAHPWLLI